MNRLPTTLKIAVAAQALAIIALGLSLFAATAPAYLGTIGIGVTSLMIGAVSFLVFVKAALK